MRKSSSKVASCGPFFLLLFCLTKASYVLDGGQQLHEVTEATSTTCGCTPPLSCNLGVATVSQQAAASGAELTVTLTGASNGQLRYVLDGGAEQTSPLFAQVAPGAHVL